MADHDTTHCQQWDMLTQDKEIAHNKDMFHKEGYAMMTTMKRLGLFGGPAKIHQMFEDYRQGQSTSPNTQPDDEDRPSLTSELIALGIGITVAALVWTYAPDHDEAN